MSKFCLPIFLLVFILGACQDTKKPGKQEANSSAFVPPDQAVATFEVEPGFTVELVASEPLIADPVDMEIDEFGRMYVVEMHGYPLDKTGSGKIKLVTDSDKDGKLDKSVVFADSLVLPNGVMRWKKGILVSDAPNIIYFEDTDGDGKSDIRDTMLTGFSLSNPHINVNNPSFAMDNWIHLAHRGAITTRNYENIFGDKGAEVYYPNHPKAVRLPKNADSRSVRFQPDKQTLETTSGRAQFGHTFDMFGHHLFGDNQNHAFAEAMGAQYISRNPEMLLGEATEAISDHGAAAEIFQITTNPERQMFSGAGVMTSASGITANLGGLFPEPFDSTVTFICESVSNLVHADKLRDSGTSFSAGRVGKVHKEFLASKDAWFRPVNLYTGPDGALYIVDYYRQIIEHPEWMSDEAVKAGGLYNGIDKGRIYRVVPNGTKAAEWIKGLTLGDMSANDLLKYLSDKNIWWRLNAQRLLLDKNDKSVQPSLENITRSESTAGRLHSLWTLEGLGILSEKIIRERLKDAVAGVRENAIRLAETHLKQYPSLAEALYPLENDPNLKVRFQLLCTLGYLNTPQAEQISHNLLFRDINDKWIQIAALTASSSKSSALLGEVLGKYKADVPAYGSLVQRLTNVIGSTGSVASISQLIKSATENNSSKLWQGPVLSGLAQGLRNRKPNPVNDQLQSLVINAFFTNTSEQVRKASLDLLKVTGITNESASKNAIAKAAAIAADTSEKNDKRVAAINFIALKNPSAYSAPLQQLIKTREHPTVQLAALQTLSAIPDTTVSSFVLREWPAITPALRDAAINTFLSNPKRIVMLLDAVEQGKVHPSSLTWSKANFLMGQDNDTIRNRARALFANKDQDRINKEYQSALDLTGDRTNGKLVYQKNCALCHQVRAQLGIKFGPDLGTVQSWLSKDIMANILDPNYSIAVGFDLWKVTMKNGESMQGIITSETSSAIELVSAPEQKSIINRQDIESLEVLNNSAMPVLTQQLDHQKMADLLAFLRQPE